MSLYSYQATDPSGKLVKGKLRANSIPELYETLKQENLYCTTYEEIREKRIRAKYKFKTKELSFMCRQLSSMLISGINIVKALHILVSQASKPKAKEVLRDIYEEVQRGSSFSAALETKRGAFPNLFISMVAAGEAAGNLDIIMVRVSEHYANENRLNNTVKKAMTYPIVLLVLMIGVVFALFGMVMPTFAGMFKSAEEIPPLTQAIMGISDVFSQYWYLILGALIGIVILINILIKIPAIRYQFDKFKCCSPKIGKLITTIYLARFARTLSNLFASGLLMVESLEKSVQVLNNTYISRHFEDVIDNVKRGESVSDSIAKTKVFDSIFTSTLYIGEESGQLDSVLEKSADFYDEEADTAVQGLVSLIEPVMLIVMGSIIMVILLAIFPAMYGSFNSVA